MREGDTRTETAAATARSRVLTRLLRAQRSGRLGHTLLFVGSGGHGAYEVALHLAQALLCEAGCWDDDAPRTMPDGEAVGVCAACRSVERFSHPDLLLIAPLSPEYRRLAAEGRTPGLDPVTAALLDDVYAPLEIGANWSITADQARELIQWAAMTPWLARGKVVIVAEADRAREDAADILLKTLEEPPDAVTFILVTARPQDLLPTVQSRCHHVRIPPLADQDIVELLVLRGVSTDQARAVVPVADGDLWRARSLLGDGANRLRRAAADLISMTLDPKRITAEVLAEVRTVLEGAAPSDVSELVRWVIWWLRDLLLILAGAAPSGEELQPLVRSAEKLGRVRLMAWLEEADRAYDMLRRNVTPSAVAAALIAFPRDERRMQAATTFPPVIPTVAP